MYFKIILKLLKAPVQRWGESIGVTRKATKGPTTLCIFVIFASISASNNSTLPSHATKVK